jgi:hypothetical protein
VTLLERIIQTLRALEIDVVVIGATAMAAHGVSRSTLDIDLFTIDPRALHQRSWDRLKPDAVDIEIRHGDASDPLRGVVRFEESGERPVDLIVGHGGWQAQALVDAESVRFGSIELPVVNPVALVLLKLYADGPQDRSDIIQLLADDATGTLTARVEEALNGLPNQLRTSWSRIEPG